MRRGARKPCDAASERCERARCAKSGVRERTDAGFFIIVDVWRGCQYFTMIMPAALLLMLRTMTDNQRMAHACAYFTIRHMRHA